MGTGTGMVYCISETVDSGVGNAGIVYCKHGASDTVVKRAQLKNYKHAGTDPDSEKRTTDYAGSGYRYRYIQNCYADPDL
jgi:hypothetical protein